MIRRELYSAWMWYVWVAACPLLLVLIGGLVVLTADASKLPFDNADLWWTLFAVPVAAGLFLFGFFRRRGAMSRFASIEVASLLAARSLPGRKAIRAGLIVMAVVFLIAAMLGPRWGLVLEKQRVYGVDIAVALDVSRSMLANDVPPNRFDRAKREIIQQLTERAVFQGSGRLALMAFAGSASLRMPLTTDHLAFRNKLEELQVGSVPHGGTAIGRAITESVDLFARSPEGATKVLLLVTDGEDHEGKPIEAARAALESHDVHVFTIGVGDPTLTAGAQVPAGEGNAAAKPLLHDGQIVFSKVDVASLRAVAEAGNGRYAPLENLNLVVDHVAGMSRTELGLEERMRHQPRYQWFLTAALAFLVLEILLSDSRRTGSATPDEWRRGWQQEMAGA